jgi:membrane associated rhomboid family serine protease
MTATIVAVNVLIHGWVTFTIYWEAPPDQPYWLDLYPFMEVPRLILDREGLGALPVLSSMFLHGGMSHLLGNMFVLWFFGRKVEDATGSVQFLLLYLLCGLSSALLSTVGRAALSPLNAQIPGLGASGAISGVLGAYLFLYSNQKVLTLISTWLVPYIPLPGGCFIPLFVPVWVPAWIFLLFHFLRDALWGQLAMELSKEMGFFPLRVDVFAHLGGAAGGVIFVLLFLHPQVIAGRR